MPLPRTALAINGGCNCKAVRYTINVPHFSSRPECPYRTPGATLEVDPRIPMVVVDHCNDCRRATGAILPMALITEIKTVSAQCSSRSAPEAIQNFRADELFDFETISSRDVFLTCYKGTPQRSRWFCSRCGTSLAYTIDPDALPAEWKWPKMLDIWLGTIDREDLDAGHDNLAPSHALWCEKGVGWIRRFARKPSISEHPTTKIDEVIDQSRGIDQILDEARSHLKRLTAKEARKEIDSSSESSSSPTVAPAILVDIRPAAQRKAEGEIPGATIVERNVLEWRFDPRSDARLAVAGRFDLRIIIFCQEGYTSSLAARSLQEIGLTNATDIVGGYKAWLDEGLPVSIEGKL